MIVLETSGGGFVLLPLVSYFGTFCPKVPTRGGATTATTYIRPYKQAAGLSAVQTMEERPLPELPKDAPPRPGRWGLSLTFKSAWPRARARLMSGGRKSTI